MFLFKSVLVYVLFFIGCLPLSQASDHIDGVPTLGLNGQVDLTDLFAFKTPGTTERLSVVLNMYPGAVYIPLKKRAHFSSKVNYDIFVSPVELGQHGEKNHYLVSREGTLSVSCSFTEPAHHSHSSNGQNGRVKCNLNKEGVVLRTLEAPVGETAISGDKSFKLFTGHRADPFMFTVSHFSKVSNRESMPGPLTPVTKNFPWNHGLKSLNGGSFLEGLNVLTILVDIDLEVLGVNSESSVFAVAAQSKISQSHKVLDRVGRPEITNLTLHKFSKEAKPLKVSYNSFSPYGLSPYLPEQPEEFTEFKGRLFENIFAYDKLDSGSEWDEKSLGELTDVLLQDFLLINMAGICPVTAVDNQYFAIEKAMLKGQPLGLLCGGRRLTDDVMSAIYALYVGGLDADLSEYQTGVNVPYMSSAKEISSEFPYMALPWDDQWSTRKGALSLLKSTQEKAAE